MELDSGFEQLKAEFRAVGLPAIGMREGRVLFDGTLSSHESDVAQAIEQLHTEDESEYLSRDLESYTGALTLKNLITENQWLSFRGIQCERIRELRRQTYQNESDGLKMEADYDGSETKLQEWQAKVASIKAQYPWPGTYR
jgi:hypothetical protein